MVCGRAQQIHEELKHDLARYNRDLHKERVRAILEENGRDESDLLAVAAAHTISTAEGVLAAVAVYLARAELTDPPAET